MYDLYVEQIPEKPTRNNSLRSLLGGMEVMVALA